LCSIGLVAAAANAPELTTRDAILDEAEARFAERGFDSVSMREIAAAAGLRNQASLYHYFGNKEAMYEAVLRRGVQSLLDAVRDEGENPAVAPYLDRVLDYLREHPLLARLIQRASLDDSPVARDAVGDLVRPLYEEGIRLLRDTPSGWEADELPYLAAGLYHLIFGYFAETALLRSVMPDDPASAEAMQRQREFVHRAVTRLLSPEPGQGATQ
jgi:AcrR family transcriptional regulator